MHDHNWHALNLGKILGNFMSLELGLRAAVATLDKTMNFVWPFEQLKVGDKIKSDPITNHDSLGPTIRKFNSLVREDDRLDTSRLVGLRDALCHGRIGASEPKFPLKLVKFGKESNGMVPVEAVIDMTEAWFDEQRAFTVKAIEKVGQVCERVRRERGVQ